MVIHTRISNGLALVATLFALAGAVVFSTPNLANAQLGPGHAAKGPGPGGPGQAWTWTWICAWCAGAYRWRWPSGSRNWLRCLLAG